MKVLLLKDVYKLGRAGDIKKVADGFGRNFLLPQGLAVLATAGALKSAEKIREDAKATREATNRELAGVAERLAKVFVTFPAKAGETGKLYGSITSQMIADAINAKSGLEISRRQLDSEPIRTLGEHQVHVRLTVDLIPAVTVIVHREGEVIRRADTEEVEAAEAAEAAPAAPAAAASEEAAV